MLAATLAAARAGALDQGVELRVADEVEAVLAGNHRGILAGRVPPHELAVSSVETERLPVQAREVDDTIDHDRRAGDLAARVEAPADVSRRGVERIEPA